MSQHRVVVDVLIDPPEEGRTFLRGYCIAEAVIGAQDSLYISCAGDITH